MLIEKTIVKELHKLEDRIYLLRVHSPKIARTCTPGQFCNIKVSESDFPLLRRPFSICDVEGESIYFMFDVHGVGTDILSRKKVGDEIDILGPLGNGFLAEGDFEKAIIVAGGIGAAPFPFLYKYLTKKNILSVIGGRNSKLVVKERMKNICVATDDGSEGFKGTVIDLLKKELEKVDASSIRIFGCGPNPMLKALQKLTLEKNIDCQISVESAMACGFGICQGCPIESSDGNTYKLICKDGPVFNVKDITL